MPGPGSSEAITSEARPQWEPARRGCWKWLQHCPCSPTQQGWGCRACRACPCLWAGWTDGLGCCAWGSRAPDAALDVPGARDPLGTEGSCDSATSREGSRGPEWGVLPCCRHSGLDSQAWMWQTCRGGQMAPRRKNLLGSSSSLGCLPGLMSQGELRCFVVKEVSKGFKFLCYFGILIFPEIVKFDEDWES